jgi:RHS repeat-associated protein
VSDFTNRPENKLKTSESSENQLKLPSISLPKGGGAIRGIGEKFTTNPVLGTGSLSVPIFTTLGRSGFSPQLSLSYNSGSGNGPFGLGWSLSLPSITRKTDKGLPKYRDADESDTLILSGAEDLVPVLVKQGEDWKLEQFERIIDGSTFHIQRYRPRIEGLFSRIERWTNEETGEIHWQSISGDNITTIYGKTEESRIFDPSDKKRIFSWLICESYDDKGNATVYEYVSEDSSGIELIEAHEQNRTDKSRSANRYLKRVKYGNLPSLLVQSDITRMQWLFEVVFDYGEGHYEELPVNEGKRQYVRATKDKTQDWPVRKDPFSSYRAGFEVRTYRLCRRVLMFHHFPEELGVDDYLVRSTEFNYDENSIASFITEVIQSGYVLKNDGKYLKKSLPPLEFEYSKAVIKEEVQEIDARSLENLPYGLDNIHYQWVDIYGEGISGILTEQAGAWFYKSNLGSGKFGELELIEKIPSAAFISKYQLMDLAGDGKLDLVDFKGLVPGFYKRKETCEWEIFKPFDSLPNLDWENPNIKFLDLTGDGHADVMVTEDGVFNWYPSLAEQGFGPAEQAHTAYDEEKGPRLVFTDATQSIFMADMSGDGLTDLVRIRNGEICYWPNLGYGNFGTRITMDNSPLFDSPEQFDQRRIQLADIDGTGVTDIIYLRKNGTFLYFNQSGNSWSDAQKLTHFPSIDSLSAVTTVDLFGNGTVCIVWSSSLSVDSGRQMRYIDLMGGQKPYLLIGTKNNLGAETKVRYVSSTKFYLEDKKAGKPWITRLPFPVHVVESVEVYDRISGNRFFTRYAYHHGYFDGEEREFRGFGLVEQWDGEEFSAFNTGNSFSSATNVDQASHVPPVLTKTWFHTGAYLEEKQISRQFKDEYYRESDISEGVYGLTDEQLDAILLEDTVVPDTIFHTNRAREPFILSVQETREAYRSLKGSILRQEIYALDGTDKEDRPYRVSERNYTIELLQPRESNKNTVFFTHARETVDFHYERVVVELDGEKLADPRVSHIMVLSVDPFGNVERSVKIVYPRRNVPDRKPEQEEIHVVFMVDNFANYQKAENWYRTGLPVETQTYEIINPPEPVVLENSVELFKLEDIRILTEGLFELNKLEPEVSKTLPYEKWNWGKDPDTPDETKLRLIERVRTLYRKNDLTGFLPLGTVESLALPGETYKLALTPNLLAAVYQRKRTGQDPENLIEFPSFILGSKAQDGGGYVDLDSSGKWWITSGKIFYSPDKEDTPEEEFNFAKEHFFLPHRFVDSFEKITTVKYDKKYDLLAKEITDPLENRVESENDYRVLQPKIVRDPNGNRNEVSFNALGLVVGTAVMGKAGENKGDSLADFDSDPDEEIILAYIQNPPDNPHEILQKATTRVIYDLCAFYRSYNDPHPQPTVVCTLVRKTHGSDLLPDQLTEIQHSFSYSDGLGREIQKKTQAEPGPVPSRDNATGEIIITASGQPDMTSSDVSSRWVGSGWTIFNSKGKPVLQYEPFFTDTHRFEFDVRIGVSSVLFYDPVGRIATTIHPNHTWEKVVFDPWHKKSWDVNDTVRLDPRTDEDVSGYVSEYFKQIAPDPVAWKTWLQQLEIDPLVPPQDTPGLEPEKKAGVRTLIHADTPTIEHFDSLGRTFLTIAHNRFKQSNIPVVNPPTEELYPTRVIFDIEGNQREVIDAKIDQVTQKGRIVIRYDYDMLGNLIHQTSMEAGERWILNDATGKPIRAWDSRNHQFRTAYDQLGRPIESYMTEGTGQESLVSLIIYGENQPDPEAKNLRGKVCQVFDQAGLVTSEEYDFKGNLLRSYRQFAKDYKNTLNWSETAAVVLETEIFTSSNAYDALNQPIELIAPHSDQPGTRVNIIRPTYNEANLLKRVEVNLQGSAVATPFITGIDYNAKGQRTRIVYGSGASVNTQGVTTTYTYDPLTFRLIHLLTRRGDSAFPDDCPEPSPADWPGCQVQNLHYTYDPAGNIIHIQDYAQQTIFFSQRRVEPSNEYTYDAVYRLIEAKGREHLGQVGGAPQPHSHNDQPRVGIEWSANDGNAMGTYLERYVYDAVGNILSMQHRGCNPSNPGWKRIYVYSEASQIEPARKSNRLSSTTVEVSNLPVSRYMHDVHGNMTRMPYLASNPDPDASNIHWDYRDQLRKVDLGIGGTAYYVYDAAGQRVRKIVEKSPGLTEERVYLGGFEIFRKRNGSGEVTLERETLHVMDDKQRIALVETRTHGFEADIPEQLIRYQFGNHLGSTSLELDDSGQIISYEEYTPYGSTSYQAGRNAVEVSLKRYRYTGKERDDETGFSYHGARYYALWLGRWTKADPAGLTGGIDLYVYVASNPVVFVDPTGADSRKPSVSQMKRRLKEIDAEIAETVVTLARYDAREAKAKANLSELLVVQARIQEKIAAARADLKVKKELAEQAIEAANKAKWNAEHNWVDKLFTSYEKEKNYWAEKEKHSDWEVKPNIMLDMTDELVKATPSAAANMWSIFAGALGTAKVPARIGAFRGNDCAACTAARAITETTGIEVEVTDIIKKYGLPQRTIIGFKAALDYAKNYLTEIGIKLSAKPGGFAPIAKGGVEGFYAIFLEGGEAGGHVVFGKVAKSGITVIDDQLGKSWPSLESAVSELQMKPRAAYRIESVEWPQD